MNKKKIGAAQRILPHLTIILSTMCLVLFVIDQWFNRNMAFLANQITKWMLAALSVIAIATAVILIMRTWDADDEAAAARKAERKAAEHVHKPEPHALSQADGGDDVK